MCNKIGCFYVNSFPRSGNTWVRSMLDIILKPNLIDVNPIFYNLFNIVCFSKIPKISTYDNISKMTMIKSHGKYKTTIENIPIIYLVRDGRDAIISYYHFNVDHRGYTETFDKYFHRHVVTDKMNSYRERKLRKFMGDWSENALSHLNKKNVLIVSYEELRREPVPYFEKMLEFIGADVDLKRIENALNLGQQKLIEKNTRHNRLRGASGNWIEKLTIEQQNQFVNRHRRALEEFGYSIAISQSNCSNEL